VLALSKWQIKNFCCLLLLYNGTPMLCAGDEFMRSQQGNNNPYNQDNETLINAYSYDLPFVVQEGQAGDWLRVIDTALACPEDFVDLEQRVVLNSLGYLVQARSVVVLKSE
jgi:pullulanase/glycogen debranching enzyme